FVARVLHVGQPPQQLALVETIAARHVQHHAEVCLGVAETVNRRDRRDDDGIRPLEQRLGGGQAHLFDVLVDRGVLLDEGIGSRNVRLRLVVVVVRNEILDRALGKEHLEFAVELRRESLVVRKNQRGTLNLLYHVGDREGLPRPGHAQQRLMRKAAAETVHKLFDGLRLIARRSIVRIELKLHSSILSRWESCGTRELAPAGYFSYTLPPVFT